MMRPQNRIRLQWLLVALVAFHLLATTIVFLATGDLPRALFIFGAIVYASILVAALVLFVSAPARLVRALPTEPTREPSPEQEDGTADRIPVEDQDRSVVIIEKIPEDDEDDLIVGSEPLDHARVVFVEGTPTNDEPPTVEDAREDEAREETPVEGPTRRVEVKESGAPVEDSQTETR